MKKYNDSKIIQVHFNVGNDLHKFIDTYKDFSNFLCDAKKEINAEFNNQTNDSGSKVNINFKFKTNKSSIEIEKGSAIVWIVIGVTGAIFSLASGINSVWELHDRIKRKLDEKKRKKKELDEVELR